MKLFFLIQRVWKIFLGKDDKPEEIFYIGGAEGAAAATQK